MDRKWDFLVIATYAVLHFLHSMDNDQGQNMSVAKLEIIVELLRTDLSKSRT